VVMTDEEIARLAREHGAAAGHADLDWGASDRERARIDGCP
jgi:hypothetical protein